MVTPSSWRESYRAQYAYAESMQTELRGHLSKLPTGWYSESRIKEEKSFYQKIENGRYVDHTKLEDFLGGLIVVPPPTDVPRALAALDNFYSIRYQRPDDRDVATFNANAFPFNDIRLYGTFKVDESLPPRPLDEIVFEIQVKTFFQHAWSSATHDLIYKNDKFSWTRSRISAQVKATLEHAELMLSNIDNLDTRGVIPSHGQPEDDLNDFHRIIAAHWQKEFLPSNQKRMTENIQELCRCLKTTPAQLDELLSRGFLELRGHPEGWSPYQCIVDYLSRFQPILLKNTLKKSVPKSGLKVIHVTPEVLLRLQITLEEAPRARV